MCFFQLSFSATVKLFSLISFLLQKIMINSHFKRFALSTQLFKRVFFWIERSFGRPSFHKSSLREDTFLLLTSKRYIILFFVGIPIESLGTVKLNACKRDFGRDSQTWKTFR